MSWTLVNADSGKVTHQFQVEEKHLNINDSLHGGFLATLIDMGGTLAINTMDLKQTGVSTDISISYLAGAKLGETVKMSSQVDKLGKNLAYTSVKIWKEQGDKQKVIALGRHTKFIRYAVEEKES
ncbi:Thioesterase/thiol ester dehydrase-isomerase [Neoconidiobolus thromboides FSU 785]|nr:Thioesterase/thiol ester dehydrase-isomerase [Neoconidiobolus thromboides FSU 785]